MDLENKVVIVTGATGGIGRVLADLFQTEGAKVVRADQREPDHKEELGEGGAERFFRLDVADPEQMHQLIAFTREQFGGLDIMVNNAGIVDYGTIYETDDEMWHRQLRINLTGTFYGIRAAALEMRKNQKGGSIVNVSSIAGSVGIKFMAAYTASKGGVDSLTRAAAIDLASDNIRVNAVAPGPTASPMTRSQQDSDDFRQMVEQNIPLQRINRPEEVAWAVLYLASERAGQITGQVLPVDGGWTVR